MILDIDIHDDAVGSRARLVRDADSLEIAEIVEPALGAVDQDLVVGVAFADLELATDDVVSRARVAADVDALDIDARPFLDDVAELDRARCRVALADRADLRKGVTAPRHLGRHVLERALDLIGVVDRARRGHELAAQDLGVDVGNARSMLTPPTRYCSPSLRVMVMMYPPRSASKTASVERIWKSA